MSEIDRIRTENMDDREILLELLETQREQNGRWGELVSDYYGDASRSIVGTKPQVDENTLTIDRARTAWRVIWGAITVLSGGTIVALLRVF